MKRYSEDEVLMATKKVLFLIIIISCFMGHAYLRVRYAEAKLNMIRSER